MDKHLREIQEALREVGEVIPVPKGAFDHLRDADEARRALRDWKIDRHDRPFIPEGLTTIYEGPQRVGKTMSMVAWALDAWQRGRNVFSNIQLGFPHERLEFDEVRLADGESRFWNGHISIDELNFYFDARRSLSGPNVEASAFLLQQKKQGCNLTGTTHDLMSLDIRMRHNFDYLITPSVYPRYPEKPRYLKMLIENGPLQPHLKKSITMDCTPIMGLYDSFTVYDPFKNRAEDDKPRTKRGRPASRVAL